MRRTGRYGTIGAWCLAVAGLLGCGDVGPVVVVYTSVDRGDAEPLLRQFETRTGVRVQAVYDAEEAKTTGITTRIVAEAGRPRCDVFWNNELSQTMMLAKRGLLAAYDSPAGRDLPSACRPANTLWTATSRRVRVIVYNTRHVPADRVPRSVFELARPEWRGKVAIADPQFGTTRAHVAALFAALGPERAQKFFFDLLANDVRIVDGNAMVRSLVADASPDASPIYVGLTDTDDVLAGQADGEPVAMVFPDQDDMGAFVVPASVALVRGAPHPEQARTLIDFLVGG